MSSGKVADHVPVVLAWGTHMRDPAGVPGSRFWPDVAATIAAIWRREPVGGRYLSLPLFLTHSAFQISKHTVSK